MRRAALLAALLLLAGCTSIGPTGARAIGDAESWERQGDIEIVTTWSEDANGKEVKTVVDTCTECTERRAKGGKGGKNFYGIAIQGLIGLAMVLFQTDVF